MLSRKSNISKPDSNASHWPAVLRSNWFILLIFLLYPIGQFVQDADRFNPYWAQVICKVGIYILLALGLQLINGISGQFSLGHAGFMAIGAYASATAIEKFSTTSSNVPSPHYSNPGGVLVFYSLLCAGIMLSIATADLFKHLIKLARTSTGVLTHPHPTAKQKRWVSTPTLLILSALSLLWILVAESHIDPIGLSITRLIPAKLCPPVCMIIILIGSGILAGFGGWLVGLPTLRLRGNYLAIATLGFAEIVQVVIANTPYLGQATGLAITVYSVTPDLRRDAPPLGYFYLFPWIYGCAFLAFLLVYRIKSSAKGLAIQAVREDEIAARAVGVDNVHHKIIAFVIGAGIAGVGGALQANNIGYINPPTFSLQVSVEIVVIVTLGGLGNIYGTVIAAIALTLLPEWLRDPTFSQMRNGSGSSAIGFNLEKWRMVIYAALLIGLMLLRGVGTRKLQAVLRPLAIATGKKPPP